jgi:MFS family permease
MMEITWAVLTFCLARANTATTIYVLRFFIGLAESTFYPGMQYIIGEYTDPLALAAYLRSIQDLGTEKKS